ncbi:methyl-accepting chemotaxis protein [Fluviispira vulneris]|uniref:methyl-accepting chemotaxis protein n=1 Tax=Fluviispira vulneris TaxID=2763012 RepID=UPI00164525F9|nr:methyl-accepting chemotaxis protein [Fluviispira vulneris]
MKNKSLAFKLISSFLILLLFILSSAIYSILMNNKTQSYADDVANNWFPSVDSVAKLSNTFANYSRRNLAILTYYAFNQQNKLKKEFLDQHESWKNEMTSLIEKHKKQLVSSPEELKLIDLVDKIWVQYIDSSDEDRSLLTKNPAAAFERYQSETLKIAVTMSKALADLGKFNYDGGVNSSTKGNSLTAITNFTMTSIVIASIIISLLILQIILKSTNSISQAVTNLKKQSVSTSKIASELKSSSQSLSDSVTEQAASIHETSAAINEITSMVNRTAENAKESTNVAKSASDKAVEGQKTMLRLVQAMETIQESSGQLQNIAVIINQINSKTAVINDIVSKTELLSLNASIESARAGEHGKGFAVVAEEVGNLAKVSGKSAHEIQELITKSQEQVNSILNLTKDRVTEGKQVTTEAQQSFLQISDDISNMSNVIQQISDATREQEIGVRQISTAMTQIDKATQSSQVAVNTTSDSSNNLVEQSNRLDSTARDIEILIKGKVMGAS